MAKITIEVPNHVIANAMTLWFENGDAVELFNESRYGQIAINEGYTLYDYPDITWDEEDDDDPSHSIEISLTNE